MPLACRGCVLGLTNEQIAEQLGFSIGSAKKYVSAGLRKLLSPGKTAVSQQPGAPPPG